MKSGKFESRQQTCTPKTNCITYLNIVEITYYITWTFLFLVTFVLEFQGYMEGIDFIAYIFMPLKIRCEFSITFLMDNYSYLYL